jgi:hypothetical protein
MMGEPHPPKDRTLVGYMLFSNDRALSDSFDRHHECIERVVKAMRDTHAEMEELAQVVGFTVPSLGSLEIRPVYAD